MSSPTADTPSPGTSPEPSPIAMRRLRALTDRAEALGIDTLVLTPGDDLAYLLGSPLHSHERMTALIVPVEGRGDEIPDPRLVLPRLILPRVEDTAESREAAARVSARVVIWADGEDPVALATEHLGSRVAVSGDMEARHLLPLMARSGAEVTGAGEIIDAVRAVKEPDERAHLADAARRIDAVHARMAEFLVAGRTEADAAERIAAAIVEEGLTHAEFVIVGSGPNGADPHHRSSDRVLTAGDVVVVDIGGPVPAGYHSDCTRTYVLGSAEDSVRAAYEHLREAQRRARAAVRPGVRIGDVDAAAREYLAAQGLGDAFIHRTGHGIGLGLHEPPSVVAGAETILEEGMTFSVEPGIYLPGRWGARLEDIVEVTATGVRELNTADRGLREV